MGGGSVVLKVIFFVERRIYKKRVRDVSGGVGAWATGGNFLQGAITGGMIGALNHSMHLGQRSLAERKALRYAGDEWSHDYSNDTYGEMPNMEDMANGGGIVADTQEMLDNTYKTVSPWARSLGRVTGGYQLFEAGDEAWQEFNATGSVSPGTATKVGISFLMLNKYVNPAVGIGVGVLDATGGTQWFYNRINSYYGR